MGKGFILRMRKITRIFDRSIDFSAFLAGIILIFIMLSVTAEVISLYFFNHALIWTLEYSEIVLLYITFLGAAWVLKKEGHVKVDIAIRRLGGRQQAMLNIATSSICTVICFIITWFGVAQTWHHYQAGLYQVTLLRIPTASILIIIPIGGFMLFVQFLRRTFHFFETLKT